MKRAILLAALLLPAAMPAHAQVTPERAQALQGQVRDWLRATLGDSAGLDRGAVTVTAAGDHYDLSYPLAAAQGAPLVTGKLTEVAGGRWSIDDLVLPSPSVFDIRVPAGKGAMASGTATLTFGQQTQHLLLDPSFATPTVASSSFGDIGIATQLPSGNQISHVDTASSNSTITPATDGRVDVVSQTKLAGYSIKRADPDDGKAVAVAIGSATLASTALGVSRERSIEVLHLLGLLADSHKADKTAGVATPTPMDRQIGLQLFGALTDLAKSGTIAEDFRDVSVTTQGMTGTLAHVGLGLDAKTDDGKLQARMPMAADGLTLPDLGLGAAMRLVPTKLTLTPTVAGVPTDAVVQWGRKAIDNAQPGDADVGALFRRGPINVGLDDFHLDVAGSSFDGTLSMLVASPAEISGSGQISATGVDNLQQALMADPQTAQAAPVLLLLKGMARNDGGRLVWDIVYREGRIAVNGQDMQALMGAVAPPAAPPARRAPQRPGTTRP